VLAYYRVRRLPLSRSMGRCYPSRFTVSVMTPNRRYPVSRIQLGRTPNRGDVAIGGFSWVARFTLTHVSPPTLLTKVSESAKRSEYHLTWFLTLALKCQRCCDSLRYRSADCGSLATPCPSGTLRNLGYTAAQLLLVERPRACALTVLAVLTRLRITVPPL